MIDYSSFTGTITQLPTGVSSTKDVGTPNLITSKGAKALLKVTDGKWDYLSLIETQVKSSTI